MQPRFSPFVCSFWVSALQKKPHLCDCVVIISRCFVEGLISRFIHEPTLSHTHTHTLSRADTAGCLGPLELIWPGQLWHLEHTHTHTNTQRERQGHTHLFSLTHILYSLPCELHYLSLWAVCWWQQRLTAVTKVNLASLSLSRFNALNATTPPSRSTSGRVAPASGPSNPTPSRL